MKKSVRKSAGKAAKTSGRGSGRVKLEDVVLAVIKKKGQALSYKELLATIVKRKLFKTKSKNFDNVLRRTLSTSKLVKWVGRGIYDAA